LRPTTWTLQDAKNRFSAVVDAALGHEPQLVTRRGRPSVVILAVEDYERLRESARHARPSFLEHLLSIPAAEPPARGAERRGSRDAPRAADF
jgi:prevent-host-death family protein